MRRIIFGSPKETFAGKFIAILAWMVGIFFLTFSIAQLYILGIFVSVLLWYAFRDFAGRADAYFKQKKQDRIRNREIRQREAERARMEAELRKLPGIKEPKLPFCENPVPAPQPEPEPPAEAEAEPLPEPEPQIEAASDLLQEKKEMLLGRCMEVLARLIRENLPESGLCKGCYVTFDFPGTDNLAGLWVECDLTDTSQRRLLTRALRNDTDLCVSNYMETGTQAEILAYLSDKNHIPELLESLQHLSDNVDDRW